MPPFPELSIGYNDVRQKEQALVDVSVDAIPVLIHYAFAELLLGGHTTRLQAEGRLTSEKAQAWWEHLRAADERGVFLLGFTAFVVVGTKPDGQAPAPA